MKKQFIKACKEGKLEEIQKIYNENKLDIDINKVFYSVCVDGYIEIAKWMYLLDDKPNIYANDFVVFINACYNGEIELAKWLYLLEDISYIYDKNKVKYIMFKALKASCYNGHLEVAKWLINLENKPDINYNCDNDSDTIFIQACENNRFEIVKWLYSLEDKPNIRKNNDQVFKFVCVYKNIEIAKWSCTLCDDYYIEIKDEKIVNWEIKN